MMQLSLRFQALLGSLALLSGINLVSAAPATTDTADKPPGKPSSAVKLGLNGTPLSIPHAGNFASLSIEPAFWTEFSEHLAARRPTRPLPFTF